jgi:flagellar hook assembly protein FlgD
MLGQEIRTLYKGVKSTGSHQIIWDGKDNHDIELPSGLYFCRMSVQGGRWIQTKKLLLVR